MSDAENVEIVALGEFDTETQRRDFDSVSFGRFYWRGRLDFVFWEEPNEGRIYVYSDRSDVLGDDYGMRPGDIEEIKDDVRAKQVISKAVEQCFEHTTTV